MTEKFNFFLMRVKNIEEYETDDVFASFNKVEKSCNKKQNTFLGKVIFEKSR